MVILVHAYIHSGMDTLSECLFYLGTYQYPQLDRDSLWISVFSRSVPALLIPDICPA